MNKKALLRGVSREIGELNVLRDIYVESFPPEERRPWNDIVALSADPTHPLRLYAITDGCDKAVGLMTVWRFEGFSYIEHFAVSSAMRGCGIGGKVLDEVLTMCHSGETVVLEVEPLTEAYGEMARKRIDFYKSHGFVDFPHYKYVQPPYSRDLPPLELMLMSTSRDLDLDAVSEILHREVYGVK